MKIPMPAPRVLMLPRDFLGTSAVLFRHFGGLASGPRRFFRQLADFFAPFHTYYIYTRAIPYI